MSQERHLPVVNHSLYSLANTSNSSLGSLNININSSSNDSTDQSLQGPASLASSLYSSPAISTTASTAVASPNSPTLLHRWSHGFSVLSAALSTRHKLLFAGTQDSKILIYNLTNFQRIGTIATDHNGSILSLTVSNNENYLFSTSSDSLVKIWDISKLTSALDADTHAHAVYHDLGIKEVSTIYSLIDIGDIFSIALSKNLNILFFGCQNTSIQWVNLSDKHNFIKVNKKNLNKLPFIRYDKFFDSKPGIRSLEKNSSSAINEKIKKFSSKLEKSKVNLTLIEVPLNNAIQFAHNGFIYDMKIVGRETFQNSNFPGHLAPPGFGEYLISVGGDGLVKIWGIYDHTVEQGPQLKFLIDLDNDDPVLSITINGVFLYCGLTDGKVKVWDLSTFQLIKLIAKDITGEINSLVYYPNLNCLFKGTESGCSKYNLNGFTSINNPNNILNTNTIDGIPSLSSEWNSNEKLILAVDILYDYNNNNDNVLITAGHSGISIWNLPNKINDTNYLSLNDELPLKYPSNGTGSRQYLLSNSALLKFLTNFISFKTISQKPEYYIEDSRNCANFLNNIFKRLGASNTKLLPVEDGNPVVYALFKASTNVQQSSQHLPPRVVWYGHYDVVETENDKGWDTDPFNLIAQDGYLYARGVTDNKGPILSSIFAISELSQAGKLSADVVFLIEGEEESGSFGFKEVVRQHKNLIGHIDWILFSNSYWLDDYTPCLNYGLRGLISAEVEVSSKKPDRHSGVDGGVSREPTIDLINLLSKLTDNSTGRVLLPDFYKPIRPISKQELKLYETIIEKIVPLDNDKKNELNINNLLKKWRLPSLTIHKIRVSGPRNTTIIPQIASCAISMRIVPNQDICTIKSDFIRYLKQNFQGLGTNNTLKIRVFKETDPWLGDLNNDLYNILDQAVFNEWKIEPVYIREGGSIPSIRFLEKFFDADAAQIPCGQSSDNAHLNNERLRIINLFKLREILVDVFSRIPANGRAASSENVSRTVPSDASSAPTTATTLSSAFRLTSESLSAAAGKFDTASTSVADSNDGQEDYSTGTEFIFNGVAEGIKDQNTGNPQGLEEFIENLII